MQADLAIGAYIEGATIIGSEIYGGKKDAYGDYPFHVDADGNLTAKGAEITGRFITTSSIGSTLIDVNNGQMEFYNAQTGGHVGSIGTYESDTESGLAIVCDYDKKLCLGHKDEKGNVINDIVIDKDNPFPLMIDGTADGIMFAPAGATQEDIETRKVRGISVRSGLIIKDNTPHVDATIFKTPKSSKGLIIENGLITDWSVVLNTSPILGEKIQISNGLISSYNIGSVITQKTNNGLYFIKGICVADDSKEGGGQIKGYTGGLNFLIKQTSPYYKKELDQYVYGYRYAVMTLTNGIVTYAYSDPEDREMPIPKV